jgi:hypothetical protein
MTTTDTRADDGEPITADWLAAAGGTADRSGTAYTSPAASGRKLTVHLGTDDEFRLLASDEDGEAVYIACGPTRGEVRRAFAVLRVTTSGGPNQ